MRHAHLLGVIALLCCSKPAARPEQPATPLVAGATDSVVLERTRCYGTCPAYRLRVSRTGEVRFASRNLRDDQRVGVDTVEAWVTDSLVADATRFGFFSLPDSIAPGSSFCQNVVTDHPTITIGVFGRQTKTVMYYTGCLPAKNPPMDTELPGLAKLADLVDSLSRAARWVRPAGPS